MGRATDEYGFDAELPRLAEVHVAVVDHAMA